MEKIEFKLEGGVNVVEVRTGEAEPIHSGRNVEIGKVTIFAIFEFLSKQDIELNLILDFVPQ